MKSLVERIQEKLKVSKNRIEPKISDKFFSLNNIRFDITPRNLTTNKEIEKTLLEVLEPIKLVYDETFDIMTIDEFNELEGKSYNAFIDGDIIVLDPEDDSIVGSIKVIAADKNSIPSLLGSITVESLLDFANGPKYNSYLVLNNNGSEAYWIDANKLYDEFMKSPKVMASDNRNKKANIPGQVLFHSKYTGDTSDKNIYMEDTIPTAWIKDNIKKINKI